MSDKHGFGDRNQAEDASARAESGQGGPPPSWPAPPRLREDDALHRFLGGPPGAVALRLLLVSLIVGAFLMWLDIRPSDIFRGLSELVNRIWGLGFDAVREVINYVLVGAVLVVPVWLALRLLNMRGR
jgi:hypothetical protein